MGPANQSGKMIVVTDRSEDRVNERRDVGQSPRRDEQDSGKQQHEQERHEEPALPAREVAQDPADRAQAVAEPAHAAPRVITRSPTTSASIGWLARKPSASISSPMIGSPAPLNEALSTT